MNTKKRIMSVLLAISILLGTSGCRRQQEKTDDISGVIDELLEPVIEDEYVIKFRTDIDAIHPTYKLLEHYPNTDIIDKIDSQEASEALCSFSMKDFETSIDAVVKKIRENTLKFTKNANIYNGYADFKEKCFDEEYDLEYFIKLCLTDILSKSTNDIHEDLCALSDYSIVLSDDIPYDNASGRCNPNAKVIVIYYEMIKKVAEIEAAYETDSVYNYETRYQKALYNRIFQVLSHEENHARQEKCSHRENDDAITLNNYAGYPKSSTFIESSAESALYNLNIDPNSDEKSYYQYSYIDERTSESLLLLMGMTNESIEGYYNGIFDSRFSEIYDFFHLKTKDELESFYRILYSIDSTYSRTNLPTEIDYNGEKLILEYEVSNAYLIDITKLSLKNLMEYTITHPDFTLEENVTLFDFLKNKIVSHAQCYDGKNFAYGKDFSDDFDVLINSYEEFLMEHYQVSPGDVLYGGIDLTTFNAIVLNINSESISEENKEKTQKLLEKFPVLKSIAFCEYLDAYAYTIGYYFHDITENYDSIEETSTLVYTRNNK